MLLKDHVALVTGAGRGIGRAIVLRLASEGAHIIVNDIDLQAAEATADEAETCGVQSLAVQADVADFGQVERMTRSSLEYFGRIDILVNNAGQPGVSCLVVDTPPESWAATLGVNLTGTFHCCRAVVPQMIKRGKGRIVNIASLAARRISKLGGADYTASKYGVVGFSKHLAFELAAFGITVNVVCPGPTLTEMIIHKTSEDFRRQVGQQVPLGRWIEPVEQAEAVLFLVSDGARMITGQVLEVEGGQLLGLASDYHEDLCRRTNMSALNLKRIRKED